LEWRRNDNLGIATSRHDEIEAKRMILADERRMRTLGGDEGS